MSISYRCICRAAGFLALALVVGSCADREPAAPDVPIIIYLVDTLRADRLGVYGYSDRSTSPQLDKLAAESVVFEQAYAPAPWTTPSVVSLLTSTFACEHGLVTPRQRLNVSLVPLAERLADIGYYTGAFFNNPMIRASTGLDRGYAEFVKGDDTSNDWLAEMRQFLVNTDGRPGFAYLHTMEPHDVYWTPYPFIQKFGFVDMDTRKRIQTAMRRFNKANQADFLARKPVGTTINTEVQTDAMYELELLTETFNILYDASVLWADQNVGNIIALLKEQGVWDKSIFIFLSDHGEEIGDRGGWFHGQSVYEELARVPLLIHFPNGEFSGQRLTAPVSLVDVMPTILDYLGESDRCEECRGNSVLPLLRDSGSVNETGAVIPAIRINRAAYYRPWREGRGDVNVVVRQGQWKGIWNDDLQTLELYDLGKDPGEKSDLSESNGKLARQTGQIAWQWLENCRRHEQIPTDGGIRIFHTARGAWNA